MNVSLLALTETKMKEQEGLGRVWEVLKQLVEKYREKRKELHVTFMDLEKAYDKVYREAVWRVLHEYGVDGYLIRRMNSYTMKVEHV